MTYEILKKETLNIYRGFSHFLKEFDKEQLGDICKLPINENLKAELKNIAEEIKNNKFKLMILGEAKSGKSTFINTYLGVEDLLPTNTLQCTSSIIKIKNGANLKLIVTYADDLTKCYTEKSEIKEILIKNGSLEKIEEKYKDIPTIRINNDIFLIKKGEKVSPNEIKSFIENIKNEKISSMSDDEYKRLIEEYIDKYQNKWREVVKEISIEYPFDSESIKDIEIIDSPGVNAVGGLEEITRNYAKNADAIMFLQSSDAPAENKVLKELIEKYSTNKNTSFLIMTKSGKSSENSLKEKLKEIHKYYENIIAKEQIICIDSLFQSYSLLIDNKYKNYNDLIKYIENNRENVESSIPEIIYRNKCLEKDIKVVIKELKDKSNFGELEEKLNSFGRKAHYYKLENFLKNILTHLFKINSKILEQINIYEIKDPGDFVKRINELSNEIALIQNKISGTIAEVSVEYTKDLISKIDTMLEDIYKKFEIVEEFNKMEDIFNKGVEDFEDFQEKFIEDKLDDLNKRLVGLNIDNKKFLYLAPDFTKEELRNIEEEARKNSTKEIKEGVTFKKVKKKLSKDEYVRTLRDNIFYRFEDIKNKIQQYMIGYLNDTIKAYEKTLKNNLNERQEELIYTQKFKEENDNKIQIREKLSKYKQHFEDYSNEIENKYLKEIKSMIR